VTRSQMHVFAPLSNWRKSDTPSATEAKLRDLDERTLAANLKHDRVERTLRLPSKLECERGLPAARSPYSNALPTSSLSVA
jgi:hypothetical protein